VRFPSRGSEAPRNADDSVAVALAWASHRGEAVDRGLVQPNDHVAMVARTVGPRLRVRRQSRIDRRIGFGGDRNADRGTTSQRGLLHMSVGYPTLILAMTLPRRPPFARWITVWHLHRR
jgi:hypothetical protein